MSIISRLFAIVTAAFTLAAPDTAGAADQQPPTWKGAPYHAGLSHCSCCGCLRVTKEYHRELKSTYGLGFDPRNFDQTEPKFRLGRVRAYPHYWIDRTGADAR